MEREPLGKRLTRFVLLLLAICGVTLAVIVAQRFSDETLAFIVGGLFIAALLAVPLAAVAALGIAYFRFRQMRPPQQYTQIPPIIMQMPPQLPYYQGGGNGYHHTYTGGRRDWAVIGDEDNE